MTSDMNVALISKSLGFHGQPLQKIWEGERGDSDLARIGVSNVDYTQYQKRQKQFSFQDRAKRLKLHQFIAKKASSLFHNSLMNGLSSLPQTLQPSATGMCAITPTFDTFFNDKLDKNARLQHIYSLLQPGDIIFGTIYSKTASGMIIRLSCTGPPCVRVFNDLNAKAFLPNSESIQAIDRKGVSRMFITNDCVCCEVLDIMPESEKMIVGMKGTFAASSTDPKCVLGLAPTDHLPEMYKLSLDDVKETYEQILENSTGFRNPYCIDYLAKAVGLDTSVYYTNMSGLRGRFPTQEYSSDLRQVQASQWAFRSVADGIEHFKAGRHSEAFQCLNKALLTDPRNVEGLVARGALYANSGSFKKAVDDFETALKLNQNHANARKYMGETLVALGRSYEEENKIEEAKKAYQDCLVIIPRHEEAQHSLEFLWSKTGKQQFIEPTELTLPALNLKIAEQNREGGGSGLSKKDDRKEKKSKKKKSKSRKRRSSSSESSSDSSDSSDSSSGSSSSSDSSSSDDSDQAYKKKRRSKASTRPKSLSPLSKRMALMAGDQSNSTGNFDMGTTSYNFNQPYGAAPQQPGENEEYELRVRKFLELTRDEDNYEDKVRKFVEEAAKYRKDRKTSDDKAAKKKEKRKSRKMKKETKKKRKEKKSKSGKKDKDDIGKESMELREALKIFKNLPVFDMSAKLSSVEKSLNLLQEQEESHQQKEEKWKMMFAKNERKAPIATATSTSKLIPKQYAFENDDDPEVERSFGGITRGGATVGPSSAAEILALSRNKVVEPAKKQRPPTPPPSISQRLKAQGPQPPKAPAGQVVLDKFGSFRLASTEKAAAPLASTRARGSRSRSRSRRRYTSDSRSRSRSPKRRSRSRSYQRRRSSRSRSYNRSRSRSRSYSRSRSGSRDRRRGDRYIRGGRGSWNDRGTYYKPRFGNSRGGRGGGIGMNNRGIGGFRDTRNFRPARGQDRYRGSWFSKRIATGSKFRSRRSRSDSLEWNRNSYDDLREGSERDDRRGERREERDDRSPKKDAKPSGEGGSTAGGSKDKTGGDVSLEEIEKIIDKAKKEKKDDMIERNKDLVKKPTIW